MGKRECVRDVGAGILAPSKPHRGSMAATKRQRQRRRENSVALLPLTPWLRVLLNTGVRAFHHGEQSAASAAAKSRLFSRKDDSGLAKGLIMHPLDSLLKPQSIAVVGASRRAGSIGRFCTN
jgi:hypothetical protein